MEIERDDQLQKVDRLEISPNQQVVLVARIMAIAQPGSSQVVTVFFRTNDQLAPEHQMTVVIPKITGGLVTVPRAVIFGDLKLASAKPQRLLLFRNHGPTLKVTRVSSSHPNRFRGEITPLTDDEQKHIDPSLGEIQAVILITPNVEAAGPLDGDLLIEVEGASQRQLTLSVSGQVK